MAFTKLNFILMKIKPATFIESLDAKGRLELLQTLIDFYGCVTIVVDGEEDSLDGKDFKLDKRVKNECIIIKYS